MKNGFNSPINSISLKGQEWKYIHMENKENNKNVTIDTFSTLANLGWALTFLRAAGVISTDWNAITNYWLALLGISVVLGLVTAIIGLWTKGGEK